MVDYMDVFKDFRKEIIQEDKDTKCQQWEGILQKLADNAILDLLMKMKLINPKEFKKFLPADYDKEKDCDKCKKIVKRLESLEKACYSLSQYALNLCRQPDRTEYSLLKTYTGYYTANILSVMEGGDRGILEKMGYKGYKDYDDEFILASPSTQNEELAFELFLCQVYYRKMKQFCQEAISYKYDAGIIICMLERDIDDIVTFSPRTICDEIKASLRQKEAAKVAVKHGVNYDDRFRAPGRIPGDANATGDDDNEYEYVNRGININRAKETLINTDVDDDDLYENPIYDSPNDFMPLTSKTTTEKFNKTCEEPTVFDNAYFAKMTLPDDRHSVQGRNADQMRSLPHPPPGFSENRSTAVPGSYAQKVVGGDVNVYQQSNQRYQGEGNRSTSRSNSTENESVRANRMSDNLPNHMQTSTGIERPNQPIPYTSTGIERPNQPIPYTNIDLDPPPPYSVLNQNVSTSAISTTLPQPRGNKQPEDSYAPMQMDVDKETTLLERSRIRDRKPAEQYNKEYIDSAGQRSKIFFPRNVDSGEYVDMDPVKQTGNIYTEVPVRKPGHSNRGANINTETRNLGSGNSSPNDESQLASPFASSSVSKNPKTPSLYEK